MIPAICLFAVFSFPVVDNPPPLTEDQITRVRTLVKTHQEEQSTLRTSLEKAQKKLSDCYAEFELDDGEVKKLQSEILDVQAKLLRGYHTMQTELRTIVGPERFKILSKRIENAVRNSEPKK